MKTLGSIDVDNTLKERGLSHSQVAKFEREVDEHMGDVSWLRQYGLSVNPTREQVREKLCAVLYVIPYRR